MIATEVANMLVMASGVVDIQCLVVFELQVVFETAKKSLFVFEWLGVLKHVVKDAIDDLIDHLALFPRDDCNLQPLHLSNYHGFHIW